MKNNITLIDAGTGNLHSVYKALESLGADITLTDDPLRVQQAGRVVLPGVGAFGDFMAGLQKQGLDQAVKEAVHKGRPLLGICVGMQALFDLGEENGEHPGLGLISGRVIRFEDQPGLKIPHTGWNQIQFPPAADTEIWRAIPTGSYVYFNHAYYCVPRRSEDIIALTDYSLPFASAISQGNLIGVQFHPEKSQRVGLQLLSNFITLS